MKHTQHPKTGPSVPPPSLLLAQADLWGQRKKPADLKAEPGVLSCDEVLQITQRENGHHCKNREDKNFTSGQRLSEMQGFFPPLKATCPRAHCQMTLCTQQDCAWPQCHPQRAHPFQKDAENVTFVSKILLHQHHLHHLHYPP